MRNTEHSRCWTSYSDVLQLYYNRSNLAEEIAFLGIFHESNLAEVLSNWFHGNTSYWRSRNITQFAVSM